MEDPQAAIDRAGREDRPIVVLVTGGTWCDPCRWFRENTLRDPSVVSLVRNAWVPLRLRDVDAASGRWPDDILPTLLFLDSSGEEVDRLAGTATAETVRARLVEVNRRISGDGDSSETTAEDIIDEAPSDTGSESAPATDGTVDLRGAVFQVAAGTIWNDGGALWYTESLGLPDRFEEYDRDSAFLYLRDPASATILAITVTDNDLDRRLWRWDRAENGWQEVGPLVRTN
jgi:thiol-disulfide isomerase/thioredoxin